MQIVREEIIINHFGKGVNQRYIDEMEALIDEKKITNAFNDQNNIFEDKSNIVHIDARYLPETKLHKIEVQKKNGDQKTIGLAFISEAVRIEIDNVPLKDLSAICSELYVNLKNALTLSMKDVLKTQTASEAGTSYKYVIRTDDGR